MGNYIKQNVWGDDGGGHYTNQDEMYLNYLYSEIPNLNDMHVLEMGAGTGRFAFKLHTANRIKKYTILDLEKNIMDSVDFLGYRGYNNIEQVYSSQYKNLFNRNFDIFIANIVIPETPVVYRMDLLNNVLPNCEHAMVINQLNPSDQKNFKEWILGLFNNCFERVVVEKTSYGNCYAIIGTKNKKVKYEISDNNESR